MRAIIAGVARYARVRRFWLCYRQTFFWGVTSRLPVIQEFLVSIHTSRLQY